MQAQIAQYLQIQVSSIIKIEEWATCYFVVIQGLGARFVSKKVVKAGDKRREMVAKVISILEGRKVAPHEVQKVWVRNNNQVEVLVKNQISSLGLDYFRQLVAQAA